MGELLRGGARGAGRSGGEWGRTGGAVGPCPIGGGAMSSVPDPRFGLHAFREFVQHVQDAVIPASLIESQRQSSAPRPFQHKSVWMAQVGV